VDNTRPAGSFTLTRNGDQITLDASTSTDTDGTITNIDWYIQRADNTEEILTEHYAEHVDKPFYPGVVEYMTSGNVVAAVAEGQRVVEGVRRAPGAPPRRRPPRTSPGFC